MTNMIERVARVICIGVGLNPEGPDVLHAQGEQVHANWESFRGVARAAIAAMREPTGAMYMAGGIVAPSAHLADKDYKPYGTRTIGDMAAKAAWEKMIDAALEER